MSALELFEAADAMVKALQNQQEGALVNKSVPFKVYEDLRVARNKVLTGEIEFTPACPGVEVVTVKNLNVDEYHVRLLRKSADRVMLVLPKMEGRPKLRMQELAHDLRREARELESVLDNATVGRTDEGGSAQ
mgnify:CR=1 FL=1